MKASRKLGWELSARGRSITPTTVHTSQDGNSIFRVEEPCYIEPRWGYPITERGMLLERPLVPSWSRSYRPWQFAIPSQKEFARRTEVVPLDDAVLFRDLYEWNYFHFHFDVLAKMQPLMESGLRPDIPKILGKYARELRFPGEILKTGRWDIGGWCVPGAETYYRVNNLYYVELASPFEHRAEFLRSMAPTTNLAAQQPRKIYINRNSAGGRRVVNSDEVDDIMIEFGVQSVDTADMPFPDQVALLSSAKFVVAIHGAGLTNLIYSSGAPLRVVELYANNYNSWAFRDLTQALGGDWIGVPGRPGPGAPQGADFTVDAEQLRALLTTLTHDG